MSDAAADKVRRCRSGLIEDLLAAFVVAILAVLVSYGILAMLVDW